MRLDEINERLNAIAIEVDGEGANVMELKAEADSLIEERAKIMAEAKAIKETREKVAGLTTAPVQTFESEERKMEFTKDNVLKSPEYRSAWAKSLMQIPLSEVEKRALGTALTTTATTYVAATAEANGVNNGGLFIPEDVMMDLMSRIELLSPFFADVPKTDVSGYVNFPYRVGGTGASEQAEGVSNSDGQVQWANLELKVLEVSETIRVTWKLEAMSVDSFIDYITEELASAVGEKIATESLYGDGTGSLKGVTAAGIDGAYTIGTTTGTVVDIYAAIAAGIALLSKKKKVGAKIYVSTDIAEEMAFARDDEGRFMHNPINGAGISSFGGYPLAVDPFLAEGDFVIGNPRYYRFNWNEGLSVTKDSSGKQRINDYTGYALCSGNAEPNSFVYGKKS